MEDIQNQMNTILSNPEMMQRIMELAQTIKQPQPVQTQAVPPSAPEIPGFSIPDIDISMIQKLSGLAGQSNIDKNQRTLLTALSPYLSRERIYKLEKAMRAAKMANMASAFLGKSGFQFNLGR